MKSNLTIIKNSPLDNLRISLAWTIGAGVSRMICNQTSGIYHSVNYSTPRFSTYNGYMRPLVFRTSTSDQSKCYINRMLLFRCVCSNFTLKFAVNLRFYHNSILTLSVCRQVCSPCSFACRVLSTFNLSALRNSYCIWVTSL